MPDDAALRAVAELAATQHGSFTRHQAATINLSSRDLARLTRLGLIEEVLPGVLRFSSTPASWEGQMMAATLAGGGAVASHRAAARLHGLAGVANAPIEVLVRRGRYPANTGVIVHRWTDPDRRDHTRVGSIPATSVAVTLANLGAVVPTPVLEAALDSALLDRHSLRWITDTAQRLHRPGPSGTGALLRLLEDPARTGRLPESWFERLVARILDTPGLPRPELQYPVRVEDGSEYRLDLAWPDALLGAECHSRAFHSGPAQQGKDIVRDQALAITGWKLVYLTWDQAQRPRRLASIMQATYQTRMRQLHGRAS